MKEGESNGEGGGGGDRKTRLSTTLAIASTWDGLDSEALAHMTGCAAGGSCGGGYRGKIGGVGQPRLSSASLSHLLSTI